MEKEKQIKVNNQMVTVGSLSFDDGLAELSGFSIDCVSKSFALWVRKLMQGWRQGTASAKGRSEVAYSTKKPWKQKGTGRARAGDARSPLWRGGGVVFGPQPRTRSLKVPKKMKQSVLRGLVAEALDASRIKVIGWPEELSEKPKTTFAAQLLREIGIGAKDKVVLLLSAGDEMHYRLFLNLPNVHIVFFDQLNAYNLAYGKQWLLLEKDLAAFKDMVVQWT